MNGGGRVRKSESENRRRESENPIVWSQRKNGPESENAALRVRKLAANFGEEFPGNFFVNYFRVCLVFLGSVKFSPKRR